MQETSGTYLTMVRKNLPYDPSRADSGQLAGDLSYEDKYFENSKDSEDSAALVLEGLLVELPDRQRAAIEMCVLGQISYAEAGRIMGCSDQTMRRETLRALGFLHGKLGTSPWLAAILDRSYLPSASLGSDQLPEVL